jgi:hypothetical protein
VEPLCRHTEHKNVLIQDLARQPGDTPTPATSADNHLRPAASQDRLSQIETRGDSNVVKQAVFELIEPACKRIRGPEVAPRAPQSCAQEREVVAWSHASFLIKTAHSKQTRTDAS